MLALWKRLLFANPLEEWRCPVSRNPSIAMANDCNPVNLLDLQRMGLYEYLTINPMAEGRWSMFLQRIHLHSHALGYFPQKKIICRDGNKD